MPKLEAFGIWLRLDIIVFLLHSIHLKRLVFVIMYISCKSK